MSVERIYFDHAATTPVAQQVLEEMRPFFSERFGNASSLHAYGREARDAIEEARERVARLVSCKPEEIYFTSGGTESDNTALVGAWFSKHKERNTIMASKIEHHAIIHTLEFLEKQGARAVWLDVDEQGFLDLEKFQEQISRDTLLVSVMHANNEIGTIEPIEEIAKICHDYGVLFHTDAVQSFGKIPIDLKKVPVDMLSASSHKIYGPKGVGLLFIREGVSIEPLLHGGGHERGMRSGTENVAGIVGFGAAANLAEKNMEREAKRLEGLRDKIINEALQIEDSRLNGPKKKRLPNNVNLSFFGIEGESLVLRLDACGIAASTGSACSSKSLEPSHVLLAIGLSHEDAHGSLRVTLGMSNTSEHVEYFNSVLPEQVEFLRKMSPIKR
jgi:cysteine desulfurase